jgi:hypothetical protein
MADAIAEKMSRASDKHAPHEGAAGAPKKGEKFRCDVCGMEVKVTADCHCKPGEHAVFRCCGQDMEKR